MEATAAPHQHCTYVTCDTYRRAADSWVVAGKEAKRLNAKIRRVRRQWGARLWELKEQGVESYEDRYADPQAAALWAEMELLDFQKQDYLQCKRTDQATWKAIEAAGVCQYHQDRAS